MLQVLSHYNPHTAMNVDDVAARFPTIAATRPHASRSARFQHIGTYDALKRLEGEGFAIHGVQVQRVKPDGGRQGFEKHLIRLRKPGLEVSKVGDVIPEVLMRNAHDGTSSWEFMAGMMRFVCLNGLMVGTQWGSIRVTHAGKDTGKKVIDATYKVVESFARVAESVDTFKSITMSTEEQHAFAMQAFTLRYPVDAETGTTRAPVTPYALLGARRSEDRASDLWTVYNRVQENVVRGGIQGRTMGNNGQMRRASMRAITGLDAGLKINRGLFDLAESWAGSKAPARVNELAAFAA